MNQAFHQLPKEKKQAIVEAAIQEFADRGYENASTNQIVKAAGISKGLLFHYFGSKKNLYLYLIDHCLEYTLDYMDQHVSAWNSPDILKRLLNFYPLRLQLFKQKPQLYLLTADAFINMPDALKEELVKRYETLHERAFTYLFENIDLSMFRKDIDSSKALQLLTLSLDALQQKYIQIYKHRLKDLETDFPKLLDEMEQYVSILKYGLYSKEPS